MGGCNIMMLDANTTARMIRHTIVRLKANHPKYGTEPESTILEAFEELAVSFDSITERARLEALAKQQARG
jgi:hypothetical protein